MEVEHGTGKKSRSGMRDQVVAGNQLTGLEPNIDVALAALVAHHQLHVDAAFALFVTARSVGLLAHSRSN